MRAEFKSIVNVFFSNSLVLFFGIIQSFILPQILGPDEYGYWALFLLYSGYAGLLIFGFNDGFYLKYGGISYEKLNKSIFSAYNIILLSYLVLMFSIWILVLKNINLSFRYIYLYVCIGIEVALLNYKGYFILLNQATARFSIYSLGNIIQKLIITCVAAYIFFYDYKNVFYVIAASILGNLLSIIFYLYCSFDIICSKPIFNKILVKNVEDNIKAGSILTFYSVSGMLMNGFGRFFIQFNLGTLELGYYSFIFSISVLFTQIVYACSLVFFPMFRRLEVAATKTILRRIDEGLIIFSGIILLFYYPIGCFLNMFFPKYSEAMCYLAFLFPIIICQSRMSLVYGTLYKVFRFEKLMFFNVLISLIFSVLITILLYHITNAKEMIAFGTYLGYLFWVILSKYIYSRKENKKSFLLTEDIVLSGIYLIINFQFGFTLLSFFFMSIVVLASLALNINKIKSIFERG